MDINAVVLNKLLGGKSLDIWAKLKLTYLDSAYSSLYSAISRHYEKYSGIPSFDELEAELRESSAAKTLAVVRLAEEPDISPEVALDALIDRYTQGLTIELLEKFVDKLPVYDTAEIKENLSNVVLTLDQKTLSTEGVFSMADLMLFRTQEDLAKSRVFLGLNNTFDSTLGGVARQELVLIGGPRGSGKSITSSNIVVNQYEAGNCAVLFTIEMIAQEVHERNFAILAEVPYLGLKHGNLTSDEWLKVVKTRANMFEDSSNLVEEYILNRDRFKFENRLIREKKLKEDNQIIIIDDRALTISAIDLHLGKLKAKFGDKLTVCVVDYLNQIVVEGGAQYQYDWQPQIVVSKKLKDLARKHDVVMVSPYQVDSSGEARFAKGILDAPDIAVVMDAHSKEDQAITFNTTKIRGGPPLEVTSKISWDTLRIDSQEIPSPKKVKLVTNTNKKSKTTEETVVDLPWNT